MHDHELKLSGTAAEVWSLILAGQYDVARSMCLRALKTDKHNLQAIYFLGFIYLSEWKLDKAKKCFAAILSKEPGNKSVLGNLALAFSRGGELEKARKLEYAVRMHDPQFWSNYLLGLNYAVNNPYILHDAHREYGAYHTLGAQLTSRGNIECLRLGFMSSDFCSHAVSNYLRPILENKPANIKLYCYHSGPTSDAITEEFKAHADVWRDIYTIDDDALYFQVLHDDLDALIDLSGHTAYNRLPLLARRVAPVQISYLGYPCTTGVKEIDYRIVDEITDPAGSEEFASEKLLRIDPCFLCYQPRQADIPDIEDVPGRPFTFGSFARVEKITDEVVAVWSEILRQCPGSQLALKAVAFDRDPTTVRRYFDRFAANGILSDRIQFLPLAKTQRDHMQAYNHIDVMLDTFPYNGTTITCESLMMGVPVISLEGATHAGRVAESISVATNELVAIAKSKDDYALCAHDMFSDGKMSKKDRENVRSIFKNSLLCDAKTFAESFYNFIREMSVVKQETFCEAVA